MPLSGRRHRAAPHRHFLDALFLGLLRYMHMGVDVYSIFAACLSDLHCISLFYFWDPYTSRNMQKACKCAIVGRYCLYCAILLSALGALAEYGGVECRFISV